MFSVGFSSGHLGGSGTRVIFCGTMRRPDRCHPASRQRKRCAEIDEEHGVRARRHCSGDFTQVQVHRRDIADGKDEPRALALFGTDGAEDIRRGGALIVGRRRPCAAPGPAPCDFVLLPDARFVGEPELYCGRIDVFLARDLVQTGWKAFSKSSIAPSAWA